MMSADNFFATKSDNENSKIIRIQFKEENRYDSFEILSKNEDNDEKSFNKVLYHLIGLFSCTEDGTRIEIGHDRFQFYIIEGDNLYPLYQLIDNYRYGKIHNLDTLDRMVLREGLEFKLNGDKKTFIKKITHMNGKLRN